jgi:hypothetical protein
MAVAVSRTNLTADNWVLLRKFHLGNVVYKMWNCNRLFSQLFGSTLSVSFRTSSKLLLL